MAVLLESEVDGEPFSGAFFSASGSHPPPPPPPPLHAGEGGGVLSHPPAINYSLSAEPIKKCALSLTPPSINTPFTGPAPPQALAGPAPGAQDQVRPEPSELGNLRISIFRTAHYSRNPPFCCCCFSLDGFKFGPSV